MRLEVGFFQHDALPFQNHNQRHNYADRLRKRSAKCCSGRTEAESTHKEIIQADVGGTGYGDKVHWAFAVAHTTEDGTDDVICCDKGNTDKADGQIFHRTVHSFCRSRQCRNDGAHQHQQNRHQYDGHRHKECHGIAHIFCRLSAVTRTDGLPDADGRSHRKPNDHHREHMHDL